MINIYFCSFLPILRYLSTCGQKCVILGKTVPRSIPPARHKLTEHDIDCAGKTARQLTNSDYDKYGLLTGMDRANLHDMKRIFGGDPSGKLYLLMDSPAT